MLIRQQKKEKDEEAGEKMEVNFLQEVTAFEIWLETHELSISAQLLWHKLMHLSSQNEWKEIIINNVSLMKTMQMGREATLIKIKEELVQAGLIEFAKGKKGSPNCYRMIFFEDKDICKKEIVKQKKNIIYPVLINRFEEFWMAYPKKSRRNLTEKAYMDLILNNVGEVSEEKLVAAARNYKKECEILKVEENFIKMPCNWLNDLTWVDYLPENYKEPILKSNGFNNFPQRSFDFNQLERELLGIN